ncbi:MAG: hypothetical protein WD965_02320 [Actinomycetota bacterium]
MAERPDAVGVALLAVFPVVFFLGAAFFVGVLLGLAVDFFFDGMTPPRTRRLRSEYAPHPPDGEIKNHFEVRGAPESDAAAAFRSRSRSNGDLRAASGWSQVPAERVSSRPARGIFCSCPEDRSAREIRARSRERPSSCGRDEARPS